MAQFGKARYFGLGDIAEPGRPSYRAQVASGVRRDGWLRRVRYLARANYAYNYIFWLRTRSNDPAYVARGGRIERWLTQPFGRRHAATERAQAFERTDFHFDAQAIPRKHVAAFRQELETQPDYHDPYDAAFRYRGDPYRTDHPFLYMDPQRLIESEAFLEICTSPAVIDTCREILGPGAALSWAWAWISHPSDRPYQSQNWHRDSAEPFAFVRIFVPLGAIEDQGDGPTELIPATSRLQDFYTVRRYDNAEVEALKTAHGAGCILAEPGDLYFVNTFCLHRGTAPTRSRQMLTLLVSLSPSHRTPSVRKLDRSTLSPGLRARIDANPAFFRYLV